MSEKLLELRALTRHYAASGSGGAPAVVRAVDGVDLDLDAGEIVALVGESGSGKSTLLSLVAALESPTSGEVRFGGASLARLDRAGRRALRRRVQIVFQDPYESLDPRQTVAEIVGEPLEVHRIGADSAARAARVRELLDEVGLVPAQAFLGRWPAELSGGQRQRVAIASALAVGPQLLLADEPVSMLDVSVRAEILNLIDRLRRRRGIAVLLVTHDLATAAAVADRIAVMYLGRVVEIGPVREVLAGAAHPYTRALLAAHPTADPSARRSRRGTLVAGELADAVRVPSGCRFHPRCPRAAPLCRESDPEPRPLGARHLSACHFAEEVASG